MHAPATIRQLRFELSAPDTPPAHQLPERLSRLHDDRLAAVLAEELSGYPPLQLAQLRVVLPPLALSRLEQDLPEALRTALRAALAALPTTSAPPSPTEKPLALLAYFLLHGALPWHATRRTFIPDEAMRAALQQHPGALRELLRRLGGSEAVRQRLARQLSEATLGRVLVLLEPVHAPFIKEYIAHTLATHRHQPWLAIPQASLRVIVYELVLADLLLRWHVSFTRQVFLEKQIRDLAAHYNLTYEALLQRLAAMLVGRQAPTALTVTLQALQQRAQPIAYPLAREAVSQRPGALLTAPEVPAPSAYAALVHYLRVGFLPHHWQPQYSQAELSSQLALVLREGRAAVLRLGQAVGPALAATLVQRFPLAISQQIVSLLAPGQTRAFLALVAGRAAHAAQFPAARLAYQLRLWQEALGYLLRTARSAGHSPQPVPVQQWLPRHSGPWAGLAPFSYASPEGAGASREGAGIGLGYPSGSSIERRPSGRQDLRDGIGVGYTPSSRPAAWAAGSGPWPGGSDYTLSAVPDATSAHYTTAGGSHTPGAGRTDLGQGFSPRPGVGYDQTWPGSLDHTTSPGPPSRATEQAFFTYLLQESPAYLPAAAAQAGGRAGYLQALHLVLRQLLQQDARPLLAFLRQYRYHPPVLRQLAAITNFSTVLELGAQARAAPVSYLAGPSMAALATLLGETTPATATTSQRWLREVFLYFHLRLHGQPPPSAARAAWSWLREYNLPARAVAAWLLRRLAPSAPLARHPFFTWLLGGFSYPGSSILRALINEPGGQSSPSATAERPAHPSATYPAPATYFYSSATPYPAADRLGTYSHSSATPHPAADQPVAPPIDNSAPARRLAGRRELPPPAGLAFAGSQPQVLNSGRAVDSQLHQVAQESGGGRPQVLNSLAFFLGARYLAAGRAGAGAEQWAKEAGAPSQLKLAQALAWRATPFRPSASWQLAGSRPAEAFELLLAYLLHGAPIGSATRKRTLLKLVLATQPRALRAMLRRHGPAAGPVAGRLAAVATFAELALLVPSASRPAGRQAAARRALAALDALTGADAARVPAGIVFLKVLFLAFHTSPAGVTFSLRDTQRLAAAQQLPWRAVLAQLTRIRQRVPGLAATSFFGRLGALVPTRSPGRPAEPGQLAYVPPGQLAAVRRLAGGADSPLPVASSVSEIITTDSATAQPAGAAHEALLYYLLHGQFPWWEPNIPSPTALRRTLVQTARQPLTQAFLQRHKLASPVQQRLASLADFSLLHVLTESTGPGRQQRQLLRPAFARLDQLLRTQPGGSQARFHVFLREAYLTTTLAGPSAGSRVDLLRKFAASAGLSWQSSLHRVGQLLRLVPALAADPFFALLLRHYQETASPHRLARRRGLAPDSTPPADARPPTPQHQLPPSPETVAAATLATQLLEQYLRTGQLPAAYAGARAADLLRALLRAPAADLRARLLPYLERPVARHRLAALVPAAPVFLPLLQWLAPKAYQALAGIVRDWLRLLAADVVQFGKKTADLWVAVLTLAHAEVPLAAPALAAALGQALVQGERALTAGPPARPPGTPAGNAARATARPSAASPGKPVPEALRLLRLIQRSQVRLYSHLPALLAAQLSPVESGGAASQAAPPSPRRSARPHPSARPQPLPPELQPEAATYIANAGLVLVWPFLTRLFERLGYVAERQFVSIEHATRATYLLQFLVTGEDQPPEYLLTLNKLLCGLERTLPLVRELPLTDAEQATGESLLKAVMAQWGSAFKNTSLAGLRETFLQRPGKLTWAADKVTLTVETKTVDILLDQRPWSIALIKLPWMPLPLYVTWR